MYDQGRPVCFLWRISSAAVAERHRPTTNREEACRSGAHSRLTRCTGDRRFCAVPARRELVDERHCDGELPRRRWRPLGRVSPWRQQITDGPPGSHPIRRSAAATRADSLRPHSEGALRGARARPQRPPPRRLHNRSAAPPRGWRADAQTSPDNDRQRPWLRRRPETAPEVRPSMASADGHARSSYSVFMWMDRKALSRTVHLEEGVTNFCKGIRGGVYCRVERGRCRNQ